MTKTPTSFAPNTAPAVRRILEAARLSHQNGEKNASILRLIYGNVDTGKVSLEECDVVGFIARTNGQTKCPILLEPLRNSFGAVESADGGQIIRTDRILRILDVSDGRELYRAKNYTDPDLKLQPCSDTPGCTHEVLHDDSLEARFKSSQEAGEYVAFMMGYKPCFEFRTHAQYIADFEEIA